MKDEEEVSVKKIKLLDYLKKWKIGKYSDKSKGKYIFSMNNDFLGSIVDERI